MKKGRITKEREGTGGGLVQSLKGTKPGKDLLKILHRKKELNRGAKFPAQVRRKGWRPKDKKSRAAWLQFKGGRLLRVFWAKREGGVLGAVGVKTKGKDSMRMGWDI